MVGCFYQLNAFRIGSANICSLYLSIYIIIRHKICWKIYKTAIT